MSDGAIPPSQSDLIARLGCPEQWKSMPLLETMMNPSWSVGFPKCQKAIREVLKDQFKLDGFAYDYNRAPFDSCFDDFLGDRAGAFVILSGSKMSPADVRVFNRMTQDDPEDRIRIQSIFNQQLVQRYAQQINTPTSPLLGQSAVNGTNCTVSNLAGSIDPPELSGDPTLYARTLNAQALTSSGIPFLWKDLEVKSFDQGLSTWVQRNIFGCTKDMPYESLKNFTAHDPEPLACSQSKTGIEGVNSLAKSVQGALDSSHE